MNSIVEPAPLQQPNTPATSQLPAAAPSQLVIETPQKTPVPSLSPETIQKIAAAPENQHLPNVDQSTLSYKDYCKLYFANIFYVSQVCDRACLLDNNSLK